MAWYYDADGRNVGPLSDDDMAGVIRRGTVSRDTMVWADGMAEWGLAGNQRGLASLFGSAAPEPEVKKAGKDAPPDVDPPFDVAPPRPDQKLAGPWSRYFARSIDITILDTAAAYGIFYVLWQTQPAVAFQILHANQYLPGLLCLPVAMLLNAIIIVIFGNSIGKAIFGIKAYPLGRDRFSLPQSIAREFSVYFGGLAIGFPLFSLFTLIGQYRELGKTGSAGYDRGKYVVRDQSNSAVRRTFGIIVAIALYGGLVALGADSSVQQRYPTPTAWTNPTTGIATTIPAGWVYSPFNQGGATIYAFENQQTGLVAFFAGEQSTANVSTLDAYDIALKDSVATAIALGDWNPLLDDFDVTKSSGVLKDGSNPETLYTVLVNGTFWRVAFVDQIDKTPRDLMDKPLMTALLATVGYTFN